MSGESGVVHAHGPHTTATRGGEFDEVLEDSVHFRGGNQWPEGKLTC